MCTFATAICSLTSRLLTSLSELLMKAMCLQNHPTCVIFSILVWQSLPVCELIRNSGQWNLVLVPGWWCKVGILSCLRCSCPCYSQDSPFPPDVTVPETTCVLNDMMLYYVWGCMLLSVCCCILHAHTGRIESWSYVWNTYIHTPPVLCLSTLVPRQ